jgi:arabinogalactan oligomer/maltooligosaccharide transport system substrate-binding protein
MKTGFLLSLAVVFALAACKPEPAKAPEPAKPGTPGPAAAPAKAEPTEVVLWHSYRGKEKEALEDLADKFNRANPDVNLRLLNVPYDAFIDKVTIATPRGQGPDLFVFAHNLIGDWVDNYHILEPISDKIPPDTLKRFIPSTVKALVYKQSLYGLPVAFKSMTLFYNPHLVPTPPDTAEQLVQAAKVATDKGKGQYGLVFEAGLLYADAAFFHGFGGTILDDAGVPHLDEKPMIDALSWLRDLNRAGVIPPSVSSAMVTTMFNEGRAGMVISGQWFLAEIAADRQFQVALLPTMPGGQRAKPLLGSEAVYLTSFSKHKEAALKAMLFLTSDDAAYARWQKAKQTVSNAAVYDRDDVKADRVTSLFRAQAENAVLMSSRPEMQIVWSTTDGAINKTVFGDADPGQALKDAQAKVLADIGKMKK